MSDYIETTQSVRCHNCGVVNWPTAPACMTCNAPLNTRAARELLGRTTAMSFSQKVARFFEIADYLLLLPAGYGLMLSLMMLSMAPWFTFIIWGAFTGGCVLLAGFFKHSRGRLSESKVSLLWAATIIYNLVELITLWVMIGPRRNEQLFLFSLWPLFVVLLSATALWSENQRAKLS